MNQNPLPPANVAALRGILGNAKRVMEQTDAENPIVENPHVKTKGFSSGAGSEMGMAMGQPAMAPEKNMNANRGYTDQMIENSNFPANVKAAMKEHKIPAVNPAMMMQSFTAEDMGDLVEKPIPTMEEMYQQRMGQLNEQAQQPMQQMPPQQMYQQQPQQMNYGMNENVVREIVKEELMKILGGEFTKQIRENAIKSTIQTLIKEGKVKATTKKRAVRK